MRVQVLKRQTIRTGRAFNITLENVTLPNGVNVDLEIIRHPGAAAIVPLTAENQVVMLKQYRHAVGRTLWEIPAGTSEPDEEPLACAKRELVEETGLNANTWQSIGEVTPVPGYSDERIHLFLARDLAPASQNLDPDEIIEVHKVSLEKVASMIVTGEIDDAKTIAAIFRTLHSLGCLESMTPGLIRQGNP